tara:strand:- start:493 stop:1017 length:525 start_codon:yes stop_codon:yes gene_type:complete
MPHLQDPYFRQGIVLVCEHSNDGALGIIINKPFEKPELKVLFQKLLKDQDKIIKIIPKVYFGGPVLIEHGIVVHSSSYKSEDSMEISEEFSITSSRKILQDIADGNGPKQYKLMLGHAGWEAGQLEREIENGDWLMQSTSYNFVFNTEESKMWEIATGSFGVETSQISGLGGSA